MELAKYFFNICFPSLRSDSQTCGSPGTNALASPCGHFRCFPDRKTRKAPDREALRKNPENRRILSQRRAVCGRPGEPLDGAGIGLEALIFQGFFARGGRKAQTDGDIGAAHESARRGFFWRQKRWLRPPAAREPEVLWTLPVAHAGLCWCGAIEKRSCTAKPAGLQSMARRACAETHIPIRLRKLSPALYKHRPGRL